MSSKSPVRSCDDVDETALSYSEIKALCAGNPMIKEKIDLDIDVTRLKMLKSEHQNQQYRLEDNVRVHFPNSIKNCEVNIANFEKDAATIKANTPTNPDEFPKMIVKGIVYTEKQMAGEALLKAVRGAGKADGLKIGEYMGFEMLICFDSFSKQINLLLRGNITYQLDLCTDTFGNITRINHALDSLEKRLEGFKAQLENLNGQVMSAKEELENPFPQEQELVDKELRLVLLNADLNIDEPNQVGGESGVDVPNEAEARDGNADEQSATKKSTPQESPHLKRTYAYDGDEQPRTGTYGKTAPTFLDNIRNLGNRKRENPPPSAGKSSDIDI